VNNPLPQIVGQSIGDGKYLLQKVLGAGNFGTVFLAVEQLNGAAVREVALKCYSPQATAEGNVEGMLADCALPARILGSTAPPDVKRHFAQIYDFGRIDTPVGECAYVSMELIRGAETLDDIMKRNKAAGFFPRPERVLDYMEQFFTALDAAHSAGVLHRDIKGANVMVDNGVLRVMDFGMGSFLTTPNSALKTTNSLYSPENYEGRHTAASDIYQAGLMFYQLYTHIDPFASSAVEFHDTNTERLKRTQFKPLPGAQIDGVHPSTLIDAVLAKCLAYSEFSRYGSAKAVLDALKSGAGDAADALLDSDPAAALEQAKTALNDPDPGKRIAALRSAALASQALGDDNSALKYLRSAIKDAEETGALFANPSEFNALVDTSRAIYERLGRAGMARIMTKKKR
jgi:serine/threonine-protein kinase